MAQEKITLVVRPRGMFKIKSPSSKVMKATGKPVGKLPEEVSVTSIGSATGLYKEIAAKAGTSEHRLRVTKGSDGSLIPNSKDVIVESTGLRHQSTIYVKDLGMTNTVTT